MKTFVFLSLLVYILSIWNCNSQETNNNNIESILPKLLFLHGSGSASPGNDSIQCNSSQASNSITFLGSVLDGGADGMNSSGNPLSFVEIQTKPVIANITRTDRLGAFNTNSSACKDIKYTFTAVKTGYISRTIEAVAQSPITNVNFLMQRDIKLFVFPTILLKNESNVLLSGSSDSAVIGYSADGASIQFSTNSSGQASPAFPIQSTTIAVSASADGYKDCSFIYNVNSGVTSNLSNCSTIPDNGILSITMKSNTPPSNLSYSLKKYTFTTGVAVSPFSPTVNGWVSSYTISPSLPNGLTLEVGSGKISGTPTLAQTATDYTVTATNSFGSTTTTFSITISNGTIPSNLSYTGSPFTFTAGQAISSISPTITGSATAYSISPAIPAGLSLNSSTGIISGIPTSPQSTTNYTIAASNSAGSTSTIISIAISNIPSPSNLKYVGTPYTFITGIQMPSIAPASSGGAVTSYSVSPSLPASISLNTSTGVLSGTPGATQASTTYTITATNSSGSTTTTIQISIVP